MINVENVKNILTKALKTNEKLLSKLDKIIQNCVKKSKILIILRKYKKNWFVILVPKMDQDATKDECETPQFNTFLNCIYEKIFNFCPEAKADIECKEIKEFMEKCPNAQRRFREARRTSIGPFKDNLAEAMREVINGKSTTKSVD